MVCKCIMPYADVRYEECVHAMQCYASVCLRSRHGYAPRRETKKKKKKKEGTRRMTRPSRTNRGRPDGVLPGKPGVGIIVCDAWLRWRCREDVAVARAGKGEEKRMSGMRRPWWWVRFLCVFGCGFGYQSSWSGGLDGPLPSVVVARRLGGLGLGRWDVGFPFRCRLPFGRTPQL